MSINTERCLLKSEETTSGPISRQPIEKQGIVTIENNVKIWFIDLFVIIYFFIIFVSSRRWICSGTLRRYLCENAEGIARGNNESVIPRSLMERLMMKNSAGFKVERLWCATSSRTQFPTRDSKPKYKERRFRLVQTRSRQPEERGLTEDAVQWTHEEVVLLGDGGDKHSRRVWRVSHLKSPRLVKLHSDARFTETQHSLIKARKRQVQLPQEKAAWVQICF